ncbi:MAG: hypothetical protein ACRENZ_08290 [Thermodesulfobacteriota bacterium]
MPELNPAQIRETRDSLLDTIDKLNELLLDKGDELKADEIKVINRAIRQLNNAITELTAKAIGGTARDLNKAVDGIKGATKNAKDAVETLQDIKDVINIVTSLIDLGLAIASGSPGGIIKAAQGTLTTVSQTIAN